MLSIITLSFYSSVRVNICDTQPNVRLVDFVQKNEHEQLLVTGTVFTDWLFEWFHFTSSRKICFHTSVVLYLLMNTKWQQHYHPSTRTTTRMTGVVPLIQGTRWRLKGVGKTKWLFKDFMTYGVNYPFWKNKTLQSKWFQ